MAARKKISSRKKTKRGTAGKKNAAPMRRERPFLVCGIGSSAGGLSALEAFFRHVPDDCGIAFVVISHQKSGHVSMLPQLMGKCTALPVHPVEDDVTVRPGHVYIALPGRELTFQKGLLRVTAAQAHSGLYLPIDIFFRSLAEDHYENIAGVVLSGTGSDGTLGLKAINGESGLTLAQSPESAEYPGMPQSAIRNLVVDLVLPPEEMPQALQNYDRGDGYKEALPADREAMPTAQVNRILALLRDRTGRDFSDYKHSSISRRIERRMALHQLATAEEYIRYLQDNVHEIDLLFKELLITVTQFFRDPDAWRALAEKGLPRLLSGLGDDDILRAWVVGCATGEEAYSMAILLHEFCLANDRHPRVQIFASDLDESSINTARAGLYSQGIAMDVSPERLERYFVPEDGHYRVRKQIREMVVFAIQDVTRDPPFMNMDLVSCRNLLIYMNTSLQQRILPLFHYVLKQDGLLLLGSSESLGGKEDLFTAVDRKWRLYERREGPANHWLQTPVGQPRQRHDAEAGSEAPVLPAGIPKRFGDNHITRLTEHLFVEKFAPPSAIINERGDIYYLHGNTGRFLELPTGQPRMCLFEMAREGLRLELMTAVRKIAAHPRETEQRMVTITADGRPLTVVLEVSRMDEPEALAGLFLVSFRTRETEPAAAERKTGKSRAGESPPPDETRRRIRELEIELQHKDETLQGTVEELETSNEELRASNEELQSTNEELQSTNEELETSREEMQSLNEELTTVNTELQAKVEELSQVSDDMVNLLNSTGVATLFLNNDLKINRFNDLATDLFKLISSDAGRPISDLASNLEDYTDLEEDCRLVLTTLESRVRDVRLKNGTWRQMRLTPYRTSDNVIDGVVITFTDITRLMSTARISEDARSLANRIVQTLRVPLLILDGDLRVVETNRAFCDTFRIQPGQAQGRLIYEVGGQEWDIPELRHLLGEIVENNITFQGYRVEYDFPRIGSRVMALSGRALIEEQNRPDLILLAIEDLTVGEQRDGGSPA